MKTTAYAVDDDVLMKLLERKHVTLAVSSVVSGTVSIAGSA